MAKVIILDYIFVMKEKKVKLCRKEYQKLYRRKLAEKAKSNREISKKNVFIRDRRQELNVVYGDEIYC